MNPNIFLRHCRAVMLRAVYTKQSLDFVPDCEGPALIGALEFKLGAAQMENQCVKRDLHRLLDRLGMTEEEALQKIASKESP
jgi:hypothetical protein